MDSSGALSLARADRKVEVAVSNPCFELRLVLHDQDHDKALTTENACDLHRMLSGNRTKSVGPDRCLPRRGDAAERAQRLAERHEHDGKKPPYDNPSSSMYRLLEASEPDSDRS